MEVCESRDMLAGDVIAPLQNPVNAWDVNADGAAAIVDLLLIVSSLRDPGAVTAAANASSHFPDVDGDRAVTIADALSQVSHLRALRDDPFADDVSEFEIGSDLALRGESEDPLPTLSVTGNPFEFEHDDFIVFTVTVTLPEGQTQIDTIEIDYATTDGVGEGKAQDGDNDGENPEDSDYTKETGTLIFFPSGALTQQVWVSMNEDATVEPNEVMFFWIDNTAVNANVDQDDRGSTGTIWNDDVKVYVQGELVGEEEGQATPRYYTEGASTVLAHPGFKIELVGSTSNDSAQAPGDYTAVAGYETEVNALATQQNPFALVNITIHNNHPDDDLEAFLYDIGVGNDTSSGIHVHLISTSALLTIEDDE